MPKSACTAVDFIHVEFGPKHRDGALRLLAWFAKRLGAKRRRLVVVDNAGVCAPLQPIEGFQEVVVLPGDNSQREFSGWDVGSLWSKRQGDQTKDKIYIYSNDTVVRHRNFGSVRPARFLSSFRWAGRSNVPLICGDVDKLPQECVLPEAGLGRHYASTYLFALNQMAFERITPFCAPESRLDAMLAQRFESNGRLFSDAAPAPYANFLSTWLHQPGKWYAAEQLTESNFDFMRLKAKSILLEHSLTDRVLAAGGTLHSIYDGGGLVDRVLGRVGERYDKVWCMPDRFQSLRRHGAAGRSEPRHASTMADLQK